MLITETLSIRDIFTRKDPFQPQVSLCQGLVLNPLMLTEAHLMKVQLQNLLNSLEYECHFLLCLAKSFLERKFTQVFYNDVENHLLRKSRCSIVRLSLVLKGIRKPSLGVCFPLSPMLDM